MKPIFKKHNAALVNYTFQTLLVTYLVLLLIEQVFTGFVSTYMNLNWLLVFVILVGILDVFSEQPKKKNEKIKKIDYVFIIVLGVLGFLIIKFKTIELGWLSWVISVIAGIIIILLSFLVISDEEEIEKQYHRKHKKKNPLVIVLLLIIILCLISLGLGLFSSLNMLEAFRIVFGSIYVLFLPGFILSFVFFPKTKEFDSKSKEKGAIDMIERVALSFALSIAVVPLSVFYLNLIGIKINLLNSSLTILGIIIISSFILIIRIKNKSKRKRASDYNY